MLSLNHEQLGKHPEKIKKHKLFIKNITRKKQIFHQKKMIGKKSKFLC